MVLVLLSGLVFGVNLGIAVCCVIGELPGREFARFEFIGLFCFA